MIAEINFDGMYFPTLLLLALVSFFLTRVLVFVLAKTGLYRWVWHPALFDFSLFIVVLTACTSSFAHFAFIRT